MNPLGKIRSGVLLCAWLLALVPAVGARAELIVVANEYAGTFSIIDGETGAARTLDVGGDPHNLAVTAGGGRVIVTHPSAGQVSVIDPRTPRVLKRFAVPGRPHGVAVGADDRWAFIGAETGRRLYRLDLAKLELAGASAIEPAPHNLAVTATGRAWITVQGGSTLWLVDLASGAPVHRLDTPATPHDLALSRQGGGLWVTNWGSPDVFLVQGDPPRLLTVKIGGRQPHHVALTPDGAGAWITNHGSEDISVIDTAKRRELGRINKKLENLTGRVAEQQKAIDAISAQLSERSRDPLGAILDTVKRWKEKGLIPALALLGMTLFRAYLGKRRKALPTSEDTEKTE